MDSEKLQCPGVYKTGSTSVIRIPDRSHRGANASLELRSLRTKKLSLVYVGIESGAATRIRKGATPVTIVEALDRAHAASIAVSATVVLGLGGGRLWREHIDGTAAVVNRTPPDFLSTQ